MGVCVKTIRRGLETFQQAGLRQATVKLISQARHWLRSSSGTGNLHRSGAARPEASFAAEIRPGARVFAPSFHSVPVGPAR